MPNCVGAINGKHVKIKCPPNSGSRYRCYKGFFSTILMAAADSCYKFIFVDCGEYGSIGDSAAFRSSIVGKRFFKPGGPDLPFPPPKPIATGGPSLPHVLIGDEAFPLRENLMRPYPSGGNTKEEDICNYRFSRARLVIENAFGHLVRKFQILARGDIELLPSNIDTTVVACCVLHNFLMTHENVNSTLLPEDLAPVSVPRGSADPNPSILHNMVPARGNIPRTAKDIRKHFLDYFNGEGSVGFQDVYANRRRLMTDFITDFGIGHLHLFSVEK